MKRTYQRGEMYYADLGRGVGSEANQGIEPCAGSQRGADRPEAQNDDTLPLSHLC